jgi:hypothetical protein
MTIKFFTFGSIHKHPDTGESLDGQYVIISMPEGAGFDAHRARMFRYFGRQWAFEYDKLPSSIKGPCAEFPREQYDRVKLGPEVCAWMDENDPDMAPAQS